MDPHSQDLTSILDQIEEAVDINGESALADKSPVKYNDTHRTNINYSTPFYSVLLYSVLLLSTQV